MPRAATQKRQNHPMRHPEAEAIAFRHQPRVQIMNADDMLFDGHRREIAKTHKAAADVARELELNPHLWQARLAVFRDDPDRNVIQ